MTLNEIRELICEEDRPKKQTTYWVPAGLVRDGLSEEDQDSYLGYRSKQYNRDCPLRVEVPRWEPQIPDKSAEYMEQLKLEFPDMVFAEHNSNFHGKLELGDNWRIGADFRRHSLHVHLSAKKGWTACAYGNGDSVQQALADLRKEARELLADAQLIVDKLEEP